MCGEFGEVTVIIGLVINFLAFVSPLLTLRDTSSYGILKVGLPLSKSTPQNVNGRGFK